eukprot:11184222-Lingulodinium_polyedra.AAC.1
MAVARNANRQTGSRSRALHRGWPGPPPPRRAQKRAASGGASSGNRWPHVRVPKLNPMLHH